MIYSSSFHPMYITFCCFDSKHLNKENIYKIKSTLTSKKPIFKYYFIVSFWLDIKNLMHLISNNAFWR